MNQTADFTGWNDNRYGNLWTYNLNYMDYLLQPGISFGEGCKWINRFIDEIQSGKIGLTPYPIALRGINWIKFISVHHAEISGALKKKWDASLYAQYHILADNIEYHLLGNHLLEDAYSLLWGGLYFREEKWYRKSEKLLYQELNEQILADGAHFELSPMYHGILLDRLLDCINATKHNDRYAGQNALTAFMEKKASEMLGWLEAIIYRDGSIPLVNDAANGIAPSSAEIFSYARCLELNWGKKTMKESGYRKMETEQMEILIDAGQIGADYIPGHAHADTFNYEMRMNGCPFIIDTGISTYDKNNRRQYERGTSAHNTVAVNGEDSSRVWGGFRAGKRAKVSLLENTPSKIKARHNGFKGVIHERTFELSSRSLVIHDRLLPGQNTGVGFIILSPFVQTVSQTGNQIITDKAVISIRDITRIWLEDCEISNEYNKPVPAKKICYSFTGQAECRISV
ncbi:MAG: heparinase II/III family protein [Tannerella sp.]|nr:heparinase II/III family protein [Tannerella sp.]